MKKLFELSKGELDIAKEEVLALADDGEFMLIDNLLVLDKDFDFERLAFTKNVYELLFTSTRNSVNDVANDFNWRKIYKKSFCVRVHGEEKKLERDFAELIWDKLAKPKVDLKKPGIEIHFFFTKSKVVCAKLIKSINQKQFEKRRAHLRPAMHPSSLHPRLARAFVNLTGIKKGTLVDPFCGTGGILIEAGLMGLNAEGYDIDEEMAARVEKNLKRYKINHKLKLKDATTISKKLNYVAADLPYARATKSQDLEKLYSKFFTVLKKNLQKKAVIGLPDFTDNKKLLKKAKLKIEKEFTIYLHKSLSKKIYVISA